MPNPPDIDGILNAIFGITIDSIAVSLAMPLTYNPGSHIERTRGVGAPAATEPTRP